jgi:hypothetical protein
MSLLKRLIVWCLLIFSIVSFFPRSIEAVVNVKGYYRSNGTYVAPHVRSNPNGLKYDNYSWKPSQGLYNDSYGTRDSNWDTPTYLTDPDYYSGLYDYMNGASASLSDYKYTSTPINNCPSNSTPSVTDSNKCTCNSGYTMNFLKNGCVSIDAQNTSCSNANGANVIWNGTYTNDGRINCTCISGYQWSSSSSSCVNTGASNSSQSKSKQELINDILAQIAALQAIIDNMNSGVSQN